MAELTEQKLEGDRKKLFAITRFSRNFREIFVEEETIKSFLQDATAKVSFLK